MGIRIVTILLAVGILSGSTTWGQGEEVRGVNEVSYTFDGESSPPRLTVMRGDKTIIDSGELAWHTESACEVRVAAEGIEDGVALRISVSNPGDAAVALPAFQVPGIRLPAKGTRRLDNWKVVQWLPALTEEGPRVGLHPLRTYPWQCYSPVLGLRSGDVAIGAAMLYDAFGLKWEIHTNYRYDAASGMWTLIFQPSSAEVITDEGGARRLDTKELAAGETASFAITLQVTPAAEWLSSFSEYREFFRKRYGERRQQVDLRPIFAWSLSSGPQAQIVTEENPRGFNPLPVQVDGWKGFPELIREKGVAHNFERLMIWGSVGRYREHPGSNMAWEIGSGWVPEQVATEGEFRRLSEELGLQVGLWCGIAFSISEGWDTGRRHPWDPDNTADTAAIFRELDLARDRGARLIGLDATLSGLASKGGRPDAMTVFTRLMPMLHERYPEMRWIIEPAACDFLHLWGSSFIWEKNIGQPFEFAEYLAPGQEIVVALKQSEPRISDMNLNWQERVEELMFWGCTPLVFSDSQGRQVTVPEWQSPASWPTEIAATVGDLGVRFDAGKNWTLSRVDHEGERICIDTPGASYGSVAKVKDIGFIGAAHKETGQQEEVLGLRLRVDGEVVAEPVASYSCERLELVKESRMHHLRLRDRWLTADGVVEEEVWLRAESPEPLDLLYVFMYPWGKEMTDYMAVTAEGETIAMAFVNDNGFRLERQVRWVALYNRENGHGVVMTLVDAPVEVGLRTRIWDRTSPYKKHYLQIWSRRTIAPGDTARLRLRSRPFTASAESWQAVAAELAER